LLLPRASFTLRLLHLSPSPSLCCLSHRFTLRSLLFKLLLLLLLLKFTRLFPCVSVTARSFSRKLLDL
jgi:hypothetical protein